MIVVTVKSVCACSLQNMKREFWGDRVTVVSCDMRHWSAPESADIIVSELLGSFGDNELSPECLDGAQRFLKGNTQGGHPPGKPGKVKEFKNGQGKVREKSKSQAQCVLAYSQLPRVFLV